MEKAIILLILVLVAVVRNYLKEQKKAEERAAKRKQPGTPGPVASEAESFEDLMRKIREAQQPRSIFPTAPEVPRPTYTPLEPTPSIPDEEASLPPSPWEKKQAGPTTLGKPGSGFGNEDRNPLGSRGAQPSSAQPTHLKPRKQAATETDEERQLRQLAAERAALVNRMNAPLPESKKEAAYVKPHKENRYKKLLQDPANLRDAVVLQTIMERKF